ncbi:MAG: hypothetical protein K2X01_02105 [Cyanobacteria bacterium]|nr:hypothetical protein [Cyanobacteriota bacterium]
MQKTSMNLYQTLNHHPLKPQAFAMPVTSLLGFVRGMVVSIWMSFWIVFLLMSLFALTSMATAMVTIVPGHSLFHVIPVMPETGASLG